jgi:hypothetical protein
LKLWQRVLQQHWICHLRAITVICADRFRKPAQLTPATGRAAEPIAIVPSNRLTSERIMMLVCTIRTAGSVQCDVGLVDRIEVANGVMYQEACESRGCGCTNNERAVVASCFVVKLKELHRVAKII